LRVEKTPCHEQVKVRRGVAVIASDARSASKADVLLDLHAAVERRRAKSEAAKKGR
jgi:hypothetical protein